MTRAAKAFYGASPWHLVALLGCFAVAGYAVTRVLDDPLALVMLAWFVGAVIGHDLILFPVYALADLTLAGVLRAGKAPARVPPVNHIRIPVLATALTFVLFFPGIIRQGSDTYTAATGLTQEPFLARWLALVGVMFATSALVYAIRVRVAHAPDRRSLAFARNRVREGERVLAVSAVPGSEPDAVGTADALYYRDVDGHWARAGWEELSTVHEEAVRNLLVVEGFPGGEIGRVTLEPAETARLADLARTQIATSLISIQDVDLTGDVRALISASRRMADGHLVWHVQLNGPDVPTERRDALVDDAITRMATELGLAEPRTTSGHPEHDGGGERA